MNNKHNPFAQSLAAIALAGILVLTGCETSSGTSKTQETPDTVMSENQGSVTVRPATETRVPAVQAEAQPVIQTRVEKVDPGSYVPQTQLTGLLRSIGSDTMDEMMQQWEVEFGRFHPALRFRHEGKGSSSAVPALLEDRADFGPMSRQIKASEIEAFRKDRNFAPTQFPVANDTLAVYVHKSNPILNTGLTVAQLEAIFSQGGEITRWGQLGLQGRWANAPIRLHGRNPASGTFSYFQKEAMGGKAYSSELTQHAGSAEVVESISNDPFAIGYSGIAYATEGVRAVSLGTTPGKFYEANAKNAADATYPLTRSLYMTVSLAPGATPSDLQTEFMRFIMSKPGQSVVTKIGYFPVSDRVVNEVMQLFKK